MIASTADQMVQDLRQYRLVPALKLDRFLDAHPGGAADPQELARALIQNNLITLYQARKLYQNKAAELVIGPYVLLDKLGEGGMGRVYKAQQLSLDRVVALKVVRADLLSNPVAMGRFRREAQAAGLLDHPNIVRLIDAEQFGEYHTLIMEHVDGPDLSKIVKEKGPLPVATACDYARQAALALQHAHEKGIIHRDVKPSNLLLGTDARTGAATVKVLDMGLARSAFDDPDAPDMTAITQEGTVVGTPDYMAPEQAKNSRTVDGRADLYGLGCTLFFMLTGKPPFVKGNTMEKLLSHQLDPPPPLGRFRPDVPPAVEGVVRRLLAKRPADRYEGGAQAAAALQAALAAPTVVADLTGPASGVLGARPAAPGPKSGRLGAAPVAPPPSATIPVALPVHAALQAPATPPAEFAFDETQADEPPRKSSRRRPTNPLLLVAGGSGALVALLLLLRPVLFAPAAATAPEAPKAIAKTPVAPKSPPTPKAPAAPTLGERDWGRLLPRDAATVVVAHAGPLLRDPVLREELLERFPAERTFLEATFGTTLDDVERAVVVLCDTPEGESRRGLMLVQTRRPMDGVRAWLDAKGRPRPEAIPASASVSPLYSTAADGLGLHRTWMVLLDAQTLVASEDRKLVNDLLADRAARTPRDPDGPLGRALLGYDPAAAVWLGAARPDLGGRDGAVEWAAGKLTLGGRLEVEATLTGRARPPLEAAASRVTGLMALAGLADPRARVLGTLAGTQDRTFRAGQLRVAMSLPADEWRDWLRARLDEADPMLAGARLIGGGAIFRVPPRR